MLIRGGCHCGNISFTLTWQGEPTAIPARACGCSFCRKHGGVWTSQPSALLQLAFAQPERVSRYAFGTGTAQFHVCAQCGVVPVATSRIEGRLYAVVNVNTFADLDPALLQRAPADFSAEGGESRLARRQRNWIANVDCRDCG